MEKVIIDIGSGTIKSYTVDKDNNLKDLYSKSIFLKEGFSLENGFIKSKKEELFLSLIHI